MVVSVSTDLYTPFPSNLVIEDGVQSSEEGSNSDIHSPVFEVPYPSDVRYHLNHQLHIPDASTPLISASFDARYSAHHDHLDVQSPDPHLLGTIQPPNSRSVQQSLPHLHSHVDYTRLQHPVLDLGMPPPPLIHPPPALSPTEEYSFNLSQSRIPEQQLRASYDSAPPSTNRGSIAMTPAEQKTQPSAQTTTTARGNTSGGSSQSQPGPSRPRREASTVVIACRQCRARKIRCDSTRPVCHNCTRRGNECEYDAVPKRRGPDKRPGTRQRSCKKRQPEADPSGSSTLSKKRRRIEGDHDGNLISFDAKDSVINTTKRSLLIPKPMPEEASVVHLPQARSHDLETSLSPRGIASEAIYPKDGLPPARRHSPFHAYNTMQAEDERTQQIISPQVDYWDKLLDTYARTREESMHAIFDDLDFLIRDSSYWLFFLNRSTLFNNLEDPNRRNLVHPSLVLSALAMANLMQSSNLERGHNGRMFALSLRDAAQASLEATCSAAGSGSTRLDIALAEAALILALFESSCHPQHSTARVESSLRLLDSIIRTLLLTRIDENDPDVCAFQPESVPTVFFPSNYESPTHCACPSILSSNPLSPLDQNSLYLSCNPDWGHGSPAEMWKEECRRICWSALNLVASYTAQCVAFHKPPLDLYLANSSNYCILFPGEAYARTQRSQVSPKESVWALYCRSMLLWISCISPREPERPTESRATFAINAWVETRTVQDALDIHHCNTDTALMYMSREYIYNTRMTIASEFRCLQGFDNIRPPRFNSRQAQEWLFYQDQIARQVKVSVMQLGEIQGHLLSRRPFQTVWYCIQVLICIKLWDTDRSLKPALELAKSFLTPIETLNALWPCAAQSVSCQELRGRLTAACSAAGLPPPLPANLVLPPILRSRAL